MSITFNQNAIEVELEYSTVVSVEYSPICLLNETQPYEPTATVTLLAYDKKSGKEVNIKLRTQSEIAKHFLKLIGKA